MEKVEGWDGREFAPLYKDLLFIFADGSIAGQREDNATGGIGVVLANEEAVLHKFSKCYKGPTRVMCPTQVTNNRMELRAIIEGLKNFVQDYEDPGSYRIMVVSDSAYAINSAKDYLIKWQKNGWQTREGKPVKNQDLWKELIKLLEHQCCPEVIWQHCRGHQGIPLNELADKLAQSEVR